MPSVMDIAPPPLGVDIGEGYGKEPVFFCEDCPLKGDAEGIITQALVWTYGVGLNRIGAAGALKDADGNYSQPVDLPFKDKKRELFGMGGPSEYWPDSSPDLEVDGHGVIEAVGKCEQPEISQTRFLKREVRRCPALIARMMSRQTRRKIENYTNDLNDLATGD